MGSGSSIVDQSASVSTRRTGPGSSIVDCHTAILERASSVLLTRSESEIQITALIKTNPAVVGLFAQSGQGKSTFIAQLIEQFQQDDTSGFDIIHSVFIGATEGSTFVFRILSELCTTLLNDLIANELYESDLPHPARPTTMPTDISGLSGLFKYVLKTLVDNGKKVLLAFDALNELESKLGRTLGWLPTKIKATFLFSTILNKTNNDSDSDSNNSTNSTNIEDSITDVLHSLKRRFNTTVDSKNTFTLPDLNEKEQTFLLSHHAKEREEISDKVLFALSNKIDRTSPLYLKLLGPYVDVIDDVPNKLSAVYDWLLDRLIKEHPKGTIEVLMKSVACSGGALFTTQLQSIIQDTNKTTKIDALHWKLLHPFLKTTPVKHSQLQRVGFVHMQADHAIRRKWLRTEQQLQLAHLHVVPYFKQHYETGLASTLQLDAEQKQETTATNDDQQIVWRSVLLNLSKHVLGAKDYQMACDLMCTTTFFLEAKIQAGLFSELIQDYHSAGKIFGAADQDNDISCFVDFLELLQTNQHVLRPRPSIFRQQAHNCPDESTVKKSLLNSLKSSTSSAYLQWKNKQQTKPGLIATFQSPGLYYWSLDVYVPENGGTPLFACGGGDGCVHVLDFDGNEIACLEGHHSDVDRVLFHPTNPDYILSCASGPNRSGTTDVFLFSLATCSLLCALSRTNHVYDVRWHLNGSVLCIVDDSGFELVAMNDQKSELTVMEGTKWLKPERPAKEETAREEQKEKSRESNESSSSEEEEEEDDGFGACHCCCFQPSSGTNNKSVTIAIGHGAFVRIVNVPLNTQQIIAPTEDMELDGRHKEHITSMDWMKDTIVTGGIDDTVLVWSFAQKKCLRIIHCHDQYVSCVRIALDGKHVYSTSEDRTAVETELIETELIETKLIESKKEDQNQSKKTTRKNRVQLRGHSSGIRQIIPMKPRQSKTTTKNREGEEHCYCATCGDDGTVRVWDLERARKEAASFSGTGKPVTAACWMHDDGGIDNQNTRRRIFVCGDNQGAVTAYDPATSTALWVNAIAINSYYNPRTGLVSSTSHSAITDLRSATKERLIGAAAMHRRIVLFSSNGGVIIRALNAEDWINTVVISQSGDFVVAGGDAESMFVWPDLNSSKSTDLNDDEHYYRLGGKETFQHQIGGNTLGLELCQTDESLLLSGGNDCTLALWRLSSSQGTLVAHSEKLTGWVVSCAFVNERTYVVSLGGRQGCVALMSWKGQTSKELSVVTTVNNGQYMAWCGMLGGNGMIATASANKLIHVWQCIDGGRLLLKTIFPSKARFGSPDGIGGAGDVLNGELCIGDESGTLYLLNLCEQEQKY